MAGRKKKVVVAMSGGVDSSVTAALLVERGYDVHAVSLRLWERREADPRNCSDHRGAEAVAALLNVPHTVIDLRSEFAAGVVEPFARAYLQGRTPNPCVACNRDFKLGALLDWAETEGADYVATGHYARIRREDRGRDRALFRGADRSKDQSYFLFALSQAQLARTLFPLGEMHKTEVREQARRMGLPVADKPESQDICFGDYRELVESYAATRPAPGDVVDNAGAVLGHHDGIHRFTVGQRRGLGLSGSGPLYVLEVDARSRRVTVGPKRELGCRGLVAREVNWIEPPDAAEIRAEVQIRYRSPAVPCAIRRIGGDRCEVNFDRAALSVTPGQAAVFYRGDRVLGGGWIDRAIRD